MKKVYAFQRYPVIGDAWPIILAYFRGKPISRTGGRVTALPHNRTSDSRELPGLNKDTPAAH